MLQLLLLCSSLGLRSPRVRLAHPRAGRRLLATETAIDPAIEAGFVEWWSDSDEEVCDRACRVEGTLPTWLSGRLVRNGPGKWEAADGSRTYTHAFDGLAKLVSFELGAEGVLFSTRFLRTSWYDKSSKGAMPVSVTTGPVQPAWSPAEGLLAALTGTIFDNTPVNIHRLGGEGGRWVAVTDAPPLIEFDPVTLETRGRIDTTASKIVGATRKLGFGVPGFEAFSTAHPQRHPTTGETLNYFLELRPIGGPVGHIVASCAAAGSTLKRRVVGSVEFESVGVQGIPYVSRKPLHNHVVEPPASTVLRALTAYSFVQCHAHEAEAWLPALGSGIGSTSAHLLMTWLRTPSHAAGALVRRE